MTRLHLRPRFVNPISLNASVRRHEHVTLRPFAPSTNLRHPHITERGERACVCVRVCVCVRAHAIPYHTRSTAHATADTTTIHQTRNNVQLEPCLHAMPPSSCCQHLSISLLNQAVYECMQTAMQSLFVTSQSKDYGQRDRTRGFLCGQGPDGLRHRQVSQWDDCLQWIRLLPTTGTQFSGLDGFAPSSKAPRRTSDSSGRMPILGQILYFSSAPY